jgi:hypothetical protein
LGLIFLAQKELTPYVCQITGSSPVHDNSDDSDDRESDSGANSDCPGQHVSDSDIEVVEDSSLKQKTSSASLARESVSGTKRACYSLRSAGRITPGKNDKGK